VSRDPLREALDDKLGVSPRHVNRLIQQRVNEHLISRRLAMLSLAREARINIAKFAPTDEELTTLRGLERPSAAAATPAPPPAPTVTALSARTMERFERTTARENPRRRPKPKDQRKVIVVYGRDKNLRNALFSFLRAIGLDPIEWGQGMKATGLAQPSIPQTVDGIFREGAAVVVLLSPDDLVMLDPRLHKPKESKHETTQLGQARPNVLFEGGLAFGMYPEATVLMSVGEVKGFSDVSGLHITQMDGGTVQKRLELVEKLTRAGAKVDIEGKTDWMTEGVFEIEEK
jgi:predicted nucleotide-binding protein